MTANTPPPPRCHLRHLIPCVLELHLFIQFLFFSLEINKSLCDELNYPVLSRLCLTHTLSSCHRPSILSDQSILMIPLSSWESPSEKSYHRRSSLKSHCCPHSEDSVAFSVKNISRQRIIRGWANSLPASQYSLMISA